MVTSPPTTGFASLCLMQHRTFCSFFKTKRLKAKNSVSSQLAIELLDRQGHTARQETSHLGCVGILIIPTNQAYSYRGSKADKHQRNGRGPLPG
jgi:hypothetical protein